MTDPSSTIPDRRIIYVPFVAGQVDDVLEDLPLGQSASEPTRDLYVRLREARRRLEQGSTMYDMPSDDDDIMYAPMQPVRPAPEQEPRMGYGICTRDISGALGLGHVCEVFVASDGATAIRWLGGPPQSQPRWEFYDNPGVAPFEQLSKFVGDVTVIWNDSDARTEKQI